MSQQEFLRQLPNHRPQPRTGFWQWLHIDLPLLTALLLVSGFGLFVLYSASNQEIATVIRQCSRFGIAFFMMLVIAQFPPRTLHFWAPWLYGLGVALLIAVLLFGTKAMGAQRWLTIPGLGRFQPSELLKLAVPILLAWYMSERVLPPSYKTLAIAAALILIPTLLIAKQPDLGTALLIATSGVFVVLLSGISWKLVAGLITLGAASIWPLYHFMLHEYQRRRVQTFLNPEADPLGAGWNIIQSKTAIGSGGLTGKGWLNGTQSQLDFLPESSTDFIFAVLSEEFGLMGVMLLLGLYALIISRGITIALQAQDTFSRLLAGSITLTFFIYIFVNIGMVSGLLPVVGVPLPLVSYGGTSLVTLMMGFGILMSIQTHKRLI